VVSPVTNNACSEIPEVTQLEPIRTFGKTAIRELIDALADALDFIGSRFGMGGPFGNGGILPGSTGRNLNPPVSDRRGSSESEQGAFCPKGNESPRFTKKCFELGLCT